MSQCSLPKWPGVADTSWAAFWTEEVTLRDVCVRGRLAAAALSYGQCQHFTDAWKSSDLCRGTT